MVERVTTGARRFVDTISHGTPKKQLALTIVSHAPCTACGYDEFTGGAKRIDCPVCGGTGRTRTERVSYFSGYVRWITEITMFLARGVAMTGEIGDCLITTDVRNRPILEKAIDAEEAWLAVDGQRVKPKTLQEMHIGAETTSITAYCQIVRKP